MEKGKEFTDDDLITAFKNYDQEAINYIYKTHYQPLCYFVRGLIRNKAEAEDIVIEAFIKLLRKHKDFDSLPHLKGFLYTVTRNDSISFLRMVKKKTERDKELIYLMEKDEDFIQSRMVKAELLKKILDEVERLPAVRKNIFKLIFGRTDYTGNCRQPENNHGYGKGSKGPCAPGHTKRSFKEGVSLRNFFISHNAL